jgi:hypothetical protein
MTDFFFINNKIEINLEKNRNSSPVKIENKYFRFQKLYFSYIY